MGIFDKPNAKVWRYCADKAEAKGNHRKSAAKMRSWAESLEHTDGSLKDRAKRWLDRELLNPDPAENPIDCVPREVRARFTIRVTDNMTLAGFGITEYMRYRWTVVDTEDYNRPLKTGYEFTQAGAYAAAERYVVRLWEHASRTSARQHPPD